MDLSYRSAVVEVFRSAQKWTSHPRIVKPELKRDSAISAVIGEPATEGSMDMDRCRLEGSLGDALSAVLVTAGRNGPPNPEELPNHKAVEA